MIRVAWEVLQALGFKLQGLEGKSPQGQLVALEPKCGILAPIEIWDKTMMDLRHVMDEDDSAWKDDSNTMKIIEIRVVYVEISIFEVNVWVWSRLARILETPLVRTNIAAIIVQLLGYLL